MQGGALTKKERKIVMNDREHGSRQVATIIERAVNDGNLEDILFIKEHQYIKPEYFLKSTVETVLEAISDGYDDDDWKYICDHIEENPSDNMFNFLQ